MFGFEKYATITCRKITNWNDWLLKGWFTVHGTIVIEKFKKQGIICDELMGEWVM